MEQKLLELGARGAPGRVRRGLERGRPDRQRAPAHAGAAEGRLLPPALDLSGGRLPGFARGRQPPAAVHDPTNRLRLLILKPLDVPTYVEHGAADLGIVGKDVLLEQGPDVYEPSTSDSACAGWWSRSRESSGSATIRQVVLGRVATKYPNLTGATSPSAGSRSRWSARRLDRARALVGLAERIVDLVQSGETLRANGSSRWPRSSSPPRGSS
jgi:ATP phosphoribosyltransferase